jgi:hypothetical protein
MYRSHCSLTARKSYFELGAVMTAGLVFGSCLGYMITTLLVAESLPTASRRLGVGSISLVMSTTVDIY